MRTLTLVYAADLAFRLRWEIRPVLEAGGVVIAAPYVETAVAFGAACGLVRGVDSRAAAVRADARPARPRARSASSIAAGSPVLDRGYPEYCAAMLEALGAEAGVEARPARMRWRCSTGRKGRKVFRLSEKGVERAREDRYWQPAGRAAPVCFATSQRTKVIRASGNASSRSRSAA